MAACLTCTKIDSPSEPERRSRWRASHRPFDRPAFRRPSTHQPAKPAAASPSSRLPRTSTSSPWRPMAAPESRRPCLAAGSQPATHSQFRVQHPAMTRFPPEDSSDSRSTVFPPIPTAGPRPSSHLTSSQNVAVAAAGPRVHNSVRFVGQRSMRWRTSLTVLGVDILADGGDRAALGPQASCISSRALKKPLFARVPAVGIGMRNPTDMDW